MDYESDDLLYKAKLSIRRAILFLLFFFPAVFGNQVRAVTGNSSGVLVTENGGVILNQDCLAALEKTSGYGNGWISKASVHDKVMQSLRVGEFVAFHDTYTCGNCGRENSMKPNTKEKHTVCGGCGKPHSGEETYSKMIDGVEVVHESDFVNNEKNLKSVKELSWKCSNCGNVIPTETKSCPGCGGHQSTGDAVVLKTGHATEITQEDGKSELPEVPTITEARMKPYFNPDPYVPQAREKAVEKPWWKKPEAITLGAMGGIGLGLGIKWLFSTKKHEGTVAQMDWENAIGIEEFQPVQKEDWCSDVHESPHVMPKNGHGEKAGKSQIRILESKVHHYDKVFSHTRHYTEKVSYEVPEQYDDTEEETLGNGKRIIKKVRKTRYITKYRDEPRTEDIYDDVPRYADWCSYRTYTWNLVRTARTVGKNPKSEADLIVPKYQLDYLERALGMESKYSIDFTYNQKGKRLNYNKKTTKRDDFMQWRQGETVKVIKRNMGSIAGVEKVE